MPVGRKPAEGQNPAAVPVSDRLLADGRVYGRLGDAEVEF